MITSIRLVRHGIVASALLAVIAGSALANPGSNPANTRPKMPPKPPILGIPNGGRQAAFQEGHGAFGNTQGTAAGQGGQLGQSGQGGLGGGAAGGFGGGGAFGAAGGGLAAFGQFGSGGGLAGGLLGGLKGFSLGGGLLGPDCQYANGVGLYGGKPALGSATPEFESIRSTRSSGAYHILMLHPVVARAVDDR